MYRENTKPPPAESGYPMMDPDTAARRGRGIIFMLCFVPIFATVAFGGVDAWAIGVFALFSAVIAALWLYDGWRYGELVFSTNSLQLPLIGLIVIGCIQLLPLGGERLPPGLLSVPASQALSLDPYSTRMFLVRLAGYLVFFAAALTFVNSVGRIRKIVVTQIIFGSAMAFFAILQRLANVENIYGLRPAPQAIPFGSFVNQHHFAALMELLSGVTLGLLFGGPFKRDKKFLLGMAAVVMGSAAAFTGSRGGLISFAAMVSFVAGAIFLAKNAAVGDAKERRRRGLVAAASGIAVFVVLAVAAVLVGAGEGLVRGVGLSAGTQADVTSGRAHFWSIALLIFRDHPVIGAGLESFGVAFSRYDTWNGTFRVEQAHNDYLQMLADAGVLGFACVAAFIYLLIREGVSILRRVTDRFNRSVAIGALAGCAGILVHSFFDFPLRTPANAYIFLLLVALAVASGNTAEGRAARRHRSSGR